MVPADLMSRLCHIAAYEADLDTAIIGLTESALMVTESTHGMIAVVDAGRGSVVVRYIVGIDQSGAVGEELVLEEGEGYGIVAAVAAKGESALVHDVAADPRYRKLVSASLSEMAVPIRDRHGRVQAVLNLESDKKHHYTEEERQICEMIGSLIGIVMNRADLLKREEALIQIGSALDTSEKEDQLVENVLSVADQVLELNSCSIFLYDRDRDMFVLKGSTGHLQAQVGEIGYKPNEGLTGWICFNAKPLVIHDPQEDSRWLGRYLEIPAADIRSYMGAPITYRGKVVGAIRVLRKRSSNRNVDNRFTDDDLRLLEAISEQVAAGLENIRALDKALQIERMAAWGEMSAKSSHMIGNRVFAIKGDVNELKYLVTETDLDRQKLAEIQESLNQNVLRLDEILQDFRDYLTAAQVRFEEADLGDLVQDAVTEVFPRRSKVQLVMNLAPDLPKVLMDPIRIRRAISEIVENALSFFEEGQFLVTTKIAGNDDVVRARLSSGQPYVEVRFQDQGPGVQDDKKGQIFQPFFSSRVKGMGLGLSIVKGIVEAHGGTVLEVGKSGEGAEFVFLLPAVPRL